MNCSGELTREVQSNYAKSQIHEKTLSTTEVLRRSEKLNSGRNTDQSLFSLLLEIESQLGTEGRNDQLGRPKRSNQRDRQYSRVNNLSRYCEWWRTIQQEGRIHPQSETFTAGSICNQCQLGMQPANPVIRIRSKFRAIGTSYNNRLTVDKIKEHPNADRLLTESLRCSYL